MPPRPPICPERRAMRMRSKFFKDTQGLESAFESCTPDKVSVCLRLSRTAYDQALAQSAREGLTSGEYIERLIRQRAPRQPGGRRLGRYSAAVVHR